MDSSWIRLATIFMVLSDVPSSSLYSASDDDDDEDECDNTVDMDQFLDKQIECTQVFFFFFFFFFFGYFSVFQF